MERANSRIIWHGDGRKVGIIAKDTQNMSAKLVRNETKTKLNSAWLRRQLTNPLICRGFQASRYSTVIMLAPILQYNLDSNNVLRFAARPGLFVRVMQPDYSWYYFDLWLLYCGLYTTS